MASDIILYWGSVSGPCWRAMICLEEKGLSGYNSKLISFEKKDTKSDEVLKINPRGQVPAFKHGNVIVNESLAICLYLEAMFEEKKKACFEELQIWEGYLAKLGDGSYIAGKDFTLADACAFPYIAIIVRLGFNMSRYPHLAKYYDLVKDRPSVKASWPPHWRDTHSKDVLKDI